MDQFSKIVHQILVNEKRYDVKQVAHDMGMKYNTFYSRLIGRVSFKPDEIRKLMGIIDDPRLASYLLEQSDFIPVNKLLVPENPDTPDVLEGVHELVINASGVLSAVREAMQDKLIDHNENRKILDEIGEVEKCLVLLDHRLSKK